jgi:hypothetical protein
MTASFACPDKPACLASFGLVQTAKLVWINMGVKALNLLKIKKLIYASKEQFF